MIDVAHNLLDMQACMLLQQCKLLKSQQHKHCKSTAMPVLLCVTTEASQVALMVQAPSRSAEIAAQAKSVVTNASDRIQAAAQSAANALSSQQMDSAPSDKHQQGIDDQGAPSETQDGASSSSSSAYGSAPERAKHALLLRIAMVTHKYREDDCTCFDTTLSRTLKVTTVRISVCAYLLADSIRFLSIGIAWFLPMVYSAVFKFYIFYMQETQVATRTH